MCVYPGQPSFVFARDFRTLLAALDASEMTAIRHGEMPLGLGQRPGQSTTLFSVSTTSRSRLVHVEYGSSAVLPLFNTAGKASRLVHICRHRLIPLCQYDRHHRQCGARSSVTGYCSTRKPHMKIDSAIGAGAAVQSRLASRFEFRA